MDIFHCERLTDDAPPVRRVGEAVQAHRQRSTATGREVDEVDVADPDVVLGRFRRRCQCRSPVTDADRSRVNVSNLTDEKNWAPPNAVYGNASILALPGTQVRFTAKYSF